MEVQLDYSATYKGIIQAAPKKALQFLSIWAQSKCDPDPDHISIGLFFGTLCSTGPTIEVQGVSLKSTPLNFLCQT